MTDQPEREAPTAEVELVSPFEFNKLLEEHVERRVRAAVAAKDAEIAKLREENQRLVAELGWVNRQVVWQEK